jgi:hypothetical protein
MAMNIDAQLELQKVLDRCIESNAPTKANIVVFSNEKGKIVYAGLITDWPMVISSDAEWGEVREMDATNEPFAGKTVKFFSLQQILNYSGCSVLQTAHLPDTPQCVFGRLN